jgi:ribonucleoside-triphosphate reductase
MHVTVDSKINLDTMKDIVMSIIESGVKYFAFNYEINQCKECSKIFVGKTEHCPECKSENIERYMRVVGFLTKKSSWSDVRQAEDRQYYNFN